MKTDIEIAQSVELKPITEVVEKVGIGFDDLELTCQFIFPSSCKS